MKSAAKAAPLDIQDMPLFWGHSLTVLNTINFYKCRNRNFNKRKNKCISTSDYF